MPMTNDAEAAEHHMSGNRTENVRVPVGLIEDLMTWCNDELNHAVVRTQYRADLIAFHDELLTAKDGY
tara:strand:+ start:228 stop:431 length:204 start_codon:yes stop_codon:yes gene_type:complete